MTKQDQELTEGVAIAAETTEIQNTIACILSELGSWDYSKITLAIIPQKGDVRIATTKRLKKKSEVQTRQRIKDAFNRDVTFTEVSV